MAIFSKREKKIQIEVDANGLGPQQIRLLKSLNHIMAHVLTTEDEGEFFDGSAELMRVCANLIQQAHFAEELVGVDNTPYAKQALEFSMDVLQEQIQMAKIVTYDN